jgi:hypothetical protein
MRTTVTLDDRLFAMLKKRAAESGTSVSRLIEQAIRLFVRAPSPAKANERFDLITFGRGGHFSNIGLDKTSALLGADDEDRYGPRH